MARILPPRTFASNRWNSNGHWRFALFILSISIQSFVFSGVSSKAAPANSNLEDATASSTTVVYSTAIDGSTPAPKEATTHQPEEIIFVTSLKKAQPEARKRELKPVYYGTPAGRALFSPRMEYNEWTPVGRGDPLKNDPTFDYSPPVLDRVRYWDSGKEKSGDVLLLGVSSKKAPAHPHRQQMNANVNAKDNQYARSPNNIPVRRNFYMQNVSDWKFLNLAPNSSNFFRQLPTILMPPPMQSPVHPPHGETWPSRNIVQDQSLGGTTYIGVKANNGPPHPNKLPYLHSVLQKEITRPQPFSLKAHQQQQQQQQFPMSSTLLMPPPAPQTGAAVPSSPSPFSMHHSQPIYESHSTQTTPLVSAGPPPPPSMSMMYQVNQMGLLMPGAPSEEVVSIMGPTPVPMHALQSQPVQFVTESMQPAAAAMTTTTTPRPPPTLTTDAYFAHYNQPQQPLDGPMYLIIEGHSKVKTYGQGDEEAMHAPKIVPVKPTEDSVVTHVGSEEPMVKHLHKKAPLLKAEKKVKVAEGKEKKSEDGGMGGLLSFIDSSLGDFLKGSEEMEAAEEEEEENQVLGKGVQKETKRDG